MAWEVEYTDEFGAWWAGLQPSEQESVAAVVGLLEVLGPNLTFPYSSGILGSQNNRLRELRIQHGGSPYRVLYAFDPTRTALLLIGGIKSGGNRWYTRMIPFANRFYEEHLESLSDEEENDG